MAKKLMASVAFLGMVLAALSALCGMLGLTLHWAELNEVANAGLVVGMALAVFAGLPLVVMFAFQDIWRD